MHGRTPEALRQMVVGGLAHDRLAHAARRPSGHAYVCAWCGERTGPRLGERRELLPGSGLDRVVLCANCYTLTWLPFDG